MKKAGCGFDDFSTCIRILYFLYMLYKSNLLTLRTIGYSWIHSWYIVISIVYGPKWPFYSCWDYIGLFGTGICRYCTWVELSVQRRLCPIF